MAKLKFVFNDEQIEADYKSGKTFNDIAKDHNCSPATVIKYFKLKGIASRKKGRPKGSKSKDRRASSLTPEPIVIKEADLNVV